MAAVCDTQAAGSMGRTGSPEGTTTAKKIHQQTVAE